MDANQINTLPDEMDLEEFRRVEGLSYEKLRVLLGIPDRASAREIAIGKFWPKAGRMRNILKRTKGRVTLNAMFCRHCEYLESVGKLSPEMTVAE